MPPPQLHPWVSSPAIAPVLTSLRVSCAEARCAEARYSCRLRGCVRAAARAAGVAAGCGLRASRTPVVLVHRCAGIGPELLETVPHLCWFSRPVQKLACAPPPFARATTNHAVHVRARVRAH